MRLCLWIVIGAGRYNGSRYRIRSIYIFFLHPIRIMHYMDDNVRTRIVIILRKTVSVMSNMPRSDKEQMVPSEIRSTTFTVKCGWWAGRKILKLLKKYNAPLELALMRLYLLSGG